MLVTHPIPGDRLGAGEPIARNDEGVAMNFSNLKIGPRVAVLGGAMGLALLIVGATGWWAD